MLTVASLYIVAEGVDKAKLIEKVSFSVFGHKTSLRAALARMMFSLLVSTLALDALSTAAEGSPMWCLVFARFSALSSTTLPCE
jgi:hypothetical protein